jgi:hypothetical protein
VPHKCGLARGLQLAHLWGHETMEDFERRGSLDEQMEKVHALAHKILDMVNEQQEGNGFKLLALIQVLSIGAEVMEEESEVKLADNDDEEQDTATIQ